MKLAYFFVGTEGPLTTPASIQGSCPFLWIPHGGFCYFLETVATDSWLEAMIQCVQRQVNILDITMEFETDNILQNSVEHVIPQ